MKRLTYKTQQMRFNHLLRSTTLVCGMLLLPNISAGASNTITQQTRPAEQIKGSVLSNTGEPLIGVTVRATGSSAGTVTDIDGNFSINVAPGTQLTFSYTGFKSHSAKAQNGMRITLQSDVNDLNEVVVVGYGTQKKANLTGAVASVSGSVLENRPISNLGQGLQGVYLTSMYRWVRVELLAQEHRLTFVVQRLSTEVDRLCWWITYKWTPT